MIYLVFFIIFLISLLTFLPSFNLALFGDDWLAFFRYFQHVGPKSPGAWNHLTYYLTPYGAQDILMGIMQKIFGFESSWYYLTSYVLRITAAFSFYPLVFYLTKSKIASVFAVLFFSITTIGLDATNWVFNMPSYITIALLNLCLYFFLKARGESNLFSLIISAILYYFAYVTTPIRMHGSLPFILLLEVFWVIQNRNFKTTKKSVIRFSVFLAIFLIIRYTGQSQGPPQEVAERFNLGIQTISMLLSQGRFDFLFYPIVMFGSMLVPDLTGLQGQINALRQLFPLLITTILIFCLFVFLVMKNAGIFTYKLFFYILFSLGLWGVLVALIYKGNLSFFNNTNQIFSLLIGGYTLILIGFLIIKYFKEKYISQALFLGVSWSIISFFFAWWWVPTSIFPTTYRYLIVSAVGITIILATIISLGKERKQQIAIFATLCIILILHVFATRIYINNLLGTHGQEISKKIWSSIPHIQEIGRSKEPIIFYFEGDGTNGGILHDVITFGFPPHMALLYNLREEDGGLPVPMDDIRQLVSAVTDGKVFPAYGYPVKPISTDRIYAFYLLGKDNLVNITNEARNKLEQLKSEVKP
ncbi:hypothetical protein A3B42_05285 [Candidatus Daviesbacteria bacterium RIFCSPLOWO2_01_FULL_38_10]|nr:MAG: hypothetical protein A2772_00205 [Candidatus Daviesbacteria bacterium RIFCSPHIGHO2_01_FULL_38_8b]OGE38528.1 MAG: hypothetical protein A3B42_05285 [Candidatus Daviesbacteria bacterium RIFCSPLOWO2_01_FULL_38_10]OGE67947.1 MAG: hypothetical protein A3H81_01720 [Candidatus Daviesbacteria bacterium RIFCSPLOWO2_02_FULL_38_18]OGE73360.1 MAG: hypothetical protein A3H18_04860 [Candidatus Daviesbacteria bacterium RIFCSPLOWO2_12_FULL_38_10]HCB22856.1 hypothetical protein [Candidatus Daviesbacteria